MSAMAKYAVSTRAAISAQHAVTDTLMKSFRER